ncbi:M20/M25/M40 family metallo-hydrolase [Mycoplasma sp. P36-A1]|uniref:M20/M25/M40 family metallo-hydrolase n=1 Tax=Mycoplasma sp. P36-A1 TaxID=3252900 RepID=UPI003C2F474A
MNSYNEANSVFTYVRKIRKYLNENPELSNQERNTQQKIISELKDMKVEYELVSDYSVIAYVNRSKRYKKNIAFRAEMDALPIKDMNSNNNVSHASGHDISVATLLGTIKIISENQKRYDGCITFIFESSSHIYKDAKYITNSNLLKDVDYLFSLFCITEVGKNIVGCNYGLQLLGSDIIEIDWFGQAQPSSAIYNAQDAIMAAVNFSDNLRSNISSKLTPYSLVLATITKIQGGLFHDIVANYCELTLNVRYNDTYSKQLAHKIINDSINYSEKRFNVTTKNKVVYSIPPLVADEEATKLLELSSKNINNNIVFQSNLTPIYSEAVSFYAKKIKCSLGYYGANSKVNIKSPLASDKFAPDEESFKVGVAWYLELARNYLLK